MYFPGILHTDNTSALCSPNATKTLPHPGLPPRVPSGRKNRILFLKNFNAVACSNTILCQTVVIFVIHDISCFP